MGYLTTPQGMMETAAKNGKFAATVMLSKTLPNYLQMPGFYAEDLKEVTYYSRKHIVSWKDAAVECEDVNLLDETSDEYTLPQKLWILSMKNKVAS